MAASAWIASGCQKNPSTARYGGENLHPQESMQATGNIVNDLRWSAETLPGFEARRWSGYVDIKETDAPGKWYAVSLPNTGRSEDLAIPDRVMVLMNDFRVNHFAVQPHDLKLAGTAIKMSLRNPGFLDNDKVIQVVNQGAYLNELLLRETRANFLPLATAPYLSHQVWIQLINAPSWEGRLYVSLGAIRKGPVFDFFRPGVREPGALIWGERRNGSIGVITGSEGAGDDGIRPGGRDFPEEDYFFVTPGTANLNPGQTITFYASGPATWTLTGGGILSSTTGNSVTYTAPAGVGTATITAVSADDPTASVSIPIAITVPTVSLVDLISDQAALLIGGSANLIATVQGSGAFNPNVTYTITGPGTLSGTGNSRTLVATGPGVITVTATSVGDPSKSDFVTLNSTAPVPVVANVSLISDKYSMTTLQTASLIASVIVNNGGDPGVTYTITGPGTLSGTGNNRTLTPTGPGTINITATSIQDPTKSASVSIAVTVGVSITSITLNGAPQANSPTGVTNLLATVNGTGAYDASVTWSIVGAGPGTLAPGSFSSPTTSGTLTFGPTPTTGTTTVRATSVADPSKFADFVVTLGVDALITSIVVTPSATTVAPGGSFTATALVQPIARSQAVTWAVAGPATLVVTAGVPTVTTTGPGVVTITATSVANPGISGSALVNVVVTPIVNTVNAFRSTAAGVLDPTPAAVPGGTSTFVNATVSGAGAISTAVTWTVVSGGGTLLPQSGNIAQYTAPAVTTAGQSAVLRATSVQDPTKFGDVVIGFDTTIAVAAVVWSPDGPISSSWQPDNLSPVTASVNVLGTGAYNSNVTFSAPAGVTATPGVKVGTVTPVSISFSPALPEAATSYTIRATSVSDPTKFDDLVINRLLTYRPFNLLGGYYPGSPSQFGSAISDTLPGPVSPGQTFFADATVFMVDLSTLPQTHPEPIVNWTVTGPATFSVVPETLFNVARIQVQANGPGLITITGTSVADPSKVITKTVNSIVTPTVSSVTVLRPDGQLVNTTLYRGTSANPQKNIVAFTGFAVGQDLVGANILDSVNWSVFSGPGTVVDVSTTSMIFPGRGSQDVYTAGYYAPPGISPASVVLRATSYHDSSKFADVSFTLLGDPSGDVAQFTSLAFGLPAGAVPAVNPSAIDQDYFMPGANSFNFEVRRTIILKASVSGGGLGLSQGTTTTIVSGGSIATLIPIPIFPGSPGESYFSLTRSGNPGGWVKIRTASVFNPAIFTEEAFYFRPQVFSLMALKQTWGPNLYGIPPEVTANVLRVHNAGNPTQPIVVSAVNCTVLPLQEPPVPQPAEIDVANGRGIATNIFMDPVGPYSITAYSVDNPSSIQTVTFSKAPDGFVLGEISGSPLGFDAGPYQPSSYSISPAAPPKPALLKNP